MEKENLSSHAYLVVLDRVCVNFVFRDFSCIALLQSVYAESGLEYNTLFYKYFIEIVSI